MAWLPGNGFNSADDYTNGNQSWNVSLLDFFNVSSVQPIKYKKTMAVPAIMFCVGVIGNVAALLILTFKPSQNSRRIRFRLICRKPTLTFDRQYRSGVARISRSTAFYHLVKALAVMDLFGIVASSPVTMVVYMTGGVLKTGGMPLCHYFSFILVMAGNATLFAVLLMGVERFLVTKFPFQYSKLVTPFSVNLSIGIAVVCSALIALLPIVGVGSNVEHYPGTWCFFDDRSTDVGGQILSYSYAFIGLVTIAITIIFNIVVILQLWGMRKSRLLTTVKDSSPGAPKKRSSYQLDSETRMIIFLMAIIVVFTVCYAPWMFRIIINQTFNTDPSKVTEEENYIDVWALRLASLNQILDPWVYIISRVTCCRTRKESPHRNSTASMNRALDSQPQKLLIPKEQEYGNSPISRV